MNAEAFKTKDGGFQIENAVNQGERMKVQRESLGLSQRQIAKIAGISQTTVMELENGIAANGQYLFFVEMAIKKEAARVLTIAAEILTGESRKRTA